MAAAFRLQNLQIGSARTPAQRLVQHAGDEPAPQTAPAQARFDEDIEQPDTAAFDHREPVAAGRAVLHQRGVEGLAPDRGEHGGEGWGGCCCHGGCRR